jgi:nitric oxide dioxygenase
VAPNADKVAEMFYGRRFFLKPKLKRLFSLNMKQQGRKLMQSLALVVNSLDRLERVVRAVEDMGQRHLDYQILEEHYDIVAPALLWTLEQGLDDPFTLEVDEAWTAAYNIVADVMESAAYATAQ